MRVIAADRVGFGVSRSSSRWSSVAETSRTRRTELLKTQYLLTTAGVQLVQTPAATATVENDTTERLVEGAVTVLSAFNSCSYRHHYLVLVYVSAFCNSWPGVM